MPPRGYIKFGEMRNGRRIDTSNAFVNLRGRVLIMTNAPPVTQVDEHGRPEPPLAADEAATLLGFLEYQRTTLAWKCGGLDAAGLRAKVGASSDDSGRVAQAPGLR